MSEPAEVTHDGDWQLTTTKCDMYVMAYLSDYNFREVEARVRVILLTPDIAILSRAEFDRIHALLPEQP